MIAQLERELAQARLLVQAQAQVQLLVREQELGLEQLLGLGLEQALEQARLLVLASELVQHPPHQQLQSLFQRQRSRLLQHEFLSTLRQLAKALQCQLCL